jgi:hypothetical protein
MPPTIDLVGKVFTRLLVIARAPNGKSGSRWRCRCTCDKAREVEVAACNLNGGAVRSCGCMAIEATRARCTTHGEGDAHGGSAEHGVWTGMLNRCRNPKVKSYADYGGRGITVCERWLKYENFLADMGRRPSPKHEIDRKDSNGNYELRNCHWATRIQQARNKRTTIRVLLDDIDLTVPEWAEITGLKAGTIRKRLRDGWGALDALSFHAGVNNNGRQFSPPPDPDRIKKLARAYLEQCGESVPSPAAESDAA